MSLCVLGCFSCVFWGQQPEERKGEGRSCKMLLASSTNWSTGVLLGGGTLCAFHVLSHGPVSPVSINFSYTQQRTLCLSTHAFKALQLFSVGSSSQFSVGAVIDVSWMGF